MRLDVAVIGAGMAGLAAASALVAGGARVLVLEKSAAPGGRAATRRRAGPAFDHGAPYAEIAGTAFAAALARWKAAGHAAHWPDAGHAVGLPEMRALAAPLAEGLDIAWRTRVAALAQSAGGWQLELESGAPVEAATLLLAVPAPQARALLPAGTVPGLEAVEMDPCWTVMAAFDAPLPGPDIVSGDAAPLALAIREGAKPWRAPTPERWVLHAGADWSRRHLDAAGEDVALELRGALGAHLGAALPAPTLEMVHRWRHARVSRPLGRPCHWDPALRLGLAGDWCEGPGLAAAWASGRALADVVAGGW